MIYPGEYPSHLLRTTNVQALVVSGYVTVRLQVEGNPLISVSGLGTSGFVENTTLIAATNRGANTVGFRLQGTNDYTSGPREWVGAAQSLVPGGHTTYTVTPRHTYLEVAGQSGTSAVHMQISSRLRWGLLGFAKTDSFYPPFLYQARDPLTTAV